MIIWIDDIRSPPPEIPEMIIMLRSKKACQEFLQWFENEWLVISLQDTDWVLDHDLGHDEEGNPYTTMDFLRELQEICQDYYTDFIDPARVKYITENPQGKANMIAFIESWAKSIN